MPTPQWNEAAKQAIKMRKTELQQALSRAGVLGSLANWSRDELESAYIDLLLNTKGN